MARSVDAKWLKAIRLGLVLLAVAAVFGMARDIYRRRHPPPEPAADLGAEVRSSRQQAEEVSREQKPQTWAERQAALGKALSRQAWSSSDPEERRRLLMEAAAALRSAVAAFDPAAQELALATAQDDLGDALTALARSSAGAPAVQLRAEAVAAYREVVAIYSRRNMPRQRATGQEALAWLLYEHSGDAEGEESARRLAEAMAACRAALDFFGSAGADFNVERAGARTSLAILFRAAADRRQGEEAIRLLKDAVTLHRQVAKAISSEGQPFRWTRNQLFLAVALGGLARRESGEPAQKHFAEAEKIGRDLLASTTCQAEPEDRASCLTELGGLYARQGLLGGEGAERLLQEAIQDLLAALTVWRREHHPQDWPDTQALLGEAYLGLARTKSAEERTRLLGEAEKALRAALEIYGRDSAPLAWAKVQDGLGQVLLEQGDPEKSLAAFRAALAVRQRPYLPGPWIETRRHQAEALEALGRRREAAAIAKETDAFEGAGAPSG